MAHGLEGVVHLVHMRAHVLGDLRDELHGEADGRKRRLHRLERLAVFLLLFWIAEGFLDDLERLGALAEDRKNALSHFGKLFGRHGGGADVGGDFLMRFVALRARGNRFFGNKLRIVEAVDDGVNRDALVLEAFAEAQNFGHGVRILDHRRHELYRELLDRLRHFDFARAGEKLVRADATQIRAQRIL